MNEFGQARRKDDYIPSRDDPKPSPLPSGAGEKGRLCEHDGQEDFCHAHHRASTECMANEIARLRSTVARLEGALAMLYRDVEFLIEDGTLPKDAANHPATMEARAAIAPAKGGEGP